jgi:hypothetical protein
MPGGEDASGELPQSLRHQSITQDAAKNERDVKRPNARPDVVKATAAVSE